MIIKFPEFVKNMVEIDGKLYRYSKSENGRYLVGLRDMDEELNSVTIGFRTKGNGRIVLIEDDNMIYDSFDYERPKRAFITNEGTVALIDILHGDESVGEFIVFDKLGNILAKHRTTSNIIYDKDNFGLTKDGKFGWFSTAQSCNDDSNKGFIFDVLNNKVIMRSSSIWRLKGLEISLNGDIIDL